MQEHRERREAEKAANIAALLLPPRSLHRGTHGPAKIEAKPKPTRAEASARAEQEHKDALAQLGCMVCRRLFPTLEPGPVELHHLRGGGWGKGDYTTLIPLCFFHHRGATGVHGLGTKGFAHHYGFTQADLLSDARALIGEDVMLNGLEGALRAAL
jgi:hypothetical protein